jgi:hypothetical protein
LQKRKLRYKEVKQLALVYIADRGIQRMEAIPLTPLHCTEQNDGSWGKLWSGVFHLFYDKGPFDPQIIRFLICTMMGLRVYSVSGLHLLMSRDKAGKFSAGLGKNDSIFFSLQTSRSTGIASRASFIPAFWGCWIPEAQ